MAYDFNLIRIDNTDTFKEWADKCNAIIDGLNSTDFITNVAGIMTLSSSQIVTGQKTFSQSTSFSGGFTTTANYTLGGTTGTVNTSTFTVNSSNSTIGGGFEAVGARGIRFKASSASSAASLKFENAGTPQKLVFDYAGDGGVFEIGDGNKLALGGSSPTLTVNSYDWKLPATSPGATPSILKWTGSDNNLSWLAESSLAESIVTDVRDILQNSNFTLPVTLIPVGTMIAVDARILDSWETAGSPAQYTAWGGAPGWIPCDGQTLSYDENASPADITYKELVQLLEGDNSPSSGTTTLPDTIGSPAEDPIGGNSIVYLIKYKSDDTTAFSVSTTTGTAGASGIDLFNTSGTGVGSFDITGGKIGLNIDTSVFSFDGDGALTADVDTGAVGNTIAKRDASGALTVSDPTDSAHAATKGFVDRAVGEVGSVRAFPELIDGHQTYADYTNWSMTFVDKNGRGLVVGNTTSQRAGGPFPNPQPNSPSAWLNAISPITDREATFERTFPTRVNYFFIDDDGILYGSGRNNGGQIGQRDRGTGTDFIDYYSQFHESGQAPYNGAEINTLIPAMLPQKSAWPAGAVTVDKVSYGDEGEAGVGILIKTKDGVGNSYVSGDRYQGFERYETSNDATEFGGAGVPYTRGWLIGSSDNSQGALGDGSSTQTSYTSSGAKVFGLNSAGTSLWATFGITDAERSLGINSLVSADPSFVEKVNKRFHYYKENATKAGGLDTTDGLALSEWRTQLGFTGSETFDEYSYYVKKFVIGTYCSWIIVGKPGNESDNEIWFAGSNSVGQAGNGTTGNSFSPTMTVHVPALDSGRTLSLSVSAVGEGGRIFESTTPHGFKDFEQIRIGSTRYYIIRGGGDNGNLTTRFRLFQGEQNAYNALVGGGTNNAYSNLSIGSQVLTHYKKLKGIFDISVGSMQVFHSYILARRTTDTATSATELDSLPETEFDSVTVLAWGRNIAPVLGLGNINDTSTPTTVSLGTTDRPVDVIAQATSSNSFVITEDSSGNRSIRGAGSNFRGLNDPGTTQGNTTTFTLSPTISSNWWVKKVFASSGSAWVAQYAGFIFIVAQSKTNPDTYALFAGGYNNWGMFGTSKYYDRATVNYIRVPFPEDPKNIVAMQTPRGHEYFALCKTEEPGETAEEFAAKVGRVYGAGWASWRLGNTHLRNKASWHPVDAQILST